MTDTVKKKTGAGFENLLIVTFALVIILVLAVTGLFFYNRTDSVTEKQSITSINTSIFA